MRICDRCEEVLTSDHRCRPLRLALVELRARQGSGKNPQAQPEREERKTVITRDEDAFGAPLAVDKTYDVTYTGFPDPRTFVDVKFTAKLTGIEVTDEDQTTTITFANGVTIRKTTSTSDVLLIPRT